MQGVLSWPFFLEVANNEIGTYDKNMHEFYNKVYDVHNELMELEHENL